MSLHFTNLGKFRKKRKKRNFKILLKVLKKIMNEDLSAIPSKNPDTFITILISTPINIIFTVNFAYIQIKFIGFLLPIV